MHNVINKRMELAGLTQSKLAEAIDTSQSQVALFLKGRSSLNKDSLEKCFTLLGINIDIYGARFDLAQEIANHFKEEGYSIEDVIRMSKSTMAKKCNNDEILLLRDVDGEKFDKMLKSKIVDYEETFPHFKSLVIFLMNSSGKRTETAYNKNLTELASSKTMVSLLKTSPVLGALGLFLPGFGALALLVAAASSILGSNNKNHSSRMLPFIAFAKSILNQNNKDQNEK